MCSHLCLRVFDSPLKIVKAISSRGKWMVCMEIKFAQCKQSAIHTLVDQWHSVLFSSLEVILRCCFFFGIAESRSLQLFVMKRMERVCIHSQAVSWQYRESRQGSCYVYIYIYMAHQTSSSTNVNGWERCKEQRQISDRTGLVVGAALSPAWANLPVNHVLRYEALLWISNLLSSARPLHFEFWKAFEHSSNLSGKTQCSNTNTGGRVIHVIKERDKEQFLVILKKQQYSMALADFLDSVTGVEGSINVSIFRCPFCTLLH